MNRVTATAWMLVLLVGTGCPHAFGKGGTLDRAALKDVVQQLRAGDCAEDEALEQCGPEQLQLCLDECRKLGR
jgi:hypothetical protein